MRKLKIILSNGKSNVIEIPEELTQDEALEQINDNITKNFGDSVNIESVSQVNDSVEDISVEPDSDFLLDQKIKESEHPLASNAIDIASEINPRTDDANPYLTDKAFTKKWDKETLEGKAKLLSDAKDIPYEDAYSQVISLPNTSKSSVSSIMKTGDENKLGRLYPATKDLLSGPGRLLGASMDQLLSPSKMSRENFAKSYSQTEGKLPEDEEERNLFGDIGQSIIRDPWNIPLAGAGSVVTKAPRVANIVSKAGKLAPTVTAAGEGLVEESARYGLEKTLGDKEVSPWDIALGAGGAASLQGIAGPLNSYGKRAFRNAPAGGKIDKMFNEGLANPKATKVIDRIYDELPTSRNPFNSDFNIPNQLRNLNQQQKTLGAQKAGVYEGLEDLAIKYNDANDMDDILKNRFKTELADTFNKKTNEVGDKIASKKWTPKYGQEVLEEYSDLQKQFLRDYDEVGDLNKFTNLGDKIDYIKNISEHKQLGQMKADINKLKAAEVPNKKLISQKEKSLKDYNNLLLNLEDQGAFYLDDFNKMFNARKGIDKELERFYGSVGKDLKIKSKDEAALFGRNMLNDQLTFMNKELGKDIPKEAVEDVAKYGNLNEELSETSDLPNLYKMEEILRATGKGNIKKSSPYNLGNSGAISRFIGAPSGHLYKTLSEDLSNPFTRQLGTEQIGDMFRDEDEQSLF